MIRFPPRERFDRSAGMITIHNERECLWINENNIVTVRRNNNPV